MSLGVSWVQYQLGLKIRYFLLHMMTDIVEKISLQKTFVSWMNKKETQKINIFEHLFLYQERK